MSNGKSKFNFTSFLANGRLHPAGRDAVAPAWSSIRVAFLPLSPCSRKPAQRPRYQ